MLNDIYILKYIKVNISFTAIAIISRYQLPVSSNVRQITVARFTIQMKYGFTFVLSAEFSHFQCTQIDLLEELSFH